MYEKINKPFLEKSTKNRSHFLSSKYTPLFRFSYKEHFILSIGIKKWIEILKSLSLINSFPPFFKKTKIIFTLFIIFYSLNIYTS